MSIKPAKPAKNTQGPSFTADFKQREFQPSPAVARVRWLDACKSSGGQLQVEPGWRDTYSVGVYMETVGYLLYADEAWVTLAMERSVSTGRYFRDWQDIPRYAIAEFEILAEAQGLVKAKAAKAKK